MGRRLLTVLAILFFFGCAPGKKVVVSYDQTIDPLRFVQPLRRIVMAGEIPVQVRVMPHPANRWLRISWNGVNCAGSSTRPLDGEHEAFTQPPMRALKVRMGPGICVVVAEVFGSGGKLLRRASLEVDVR